MKINRRGKQRLIYLPLLFLIISISVYSSCTCIPPDDNSNVIGEWKVARNVDNVFEQDIYATIIFNADYTYNETIGGQKRFGTYELDFTQNPAYINFIPKQIYWIFNTPCTSLTKGIIKFNSADVMEIDFTQGTQGPVGFDRPTSFDISHSQLKYDLTRLK